MRKLIFMITILGVFLMSCKKDVTINPEPTKTTKELVVNSNFDWRTTKDITLYVTGMKDVNPLISNTLYVKSSNGDVIYKDLLYMSKDYVIYFSVPTTDTFVTVECGATGGNYDRTQTLYLSTNKITFDYLIKLKK